jgi:hypothetical protein
MRLNVRCCCQPTKVFGTMEVPEGAQKGQPVNYFYIPTRDNPRELIEVRHIWINIGNGVSEQQKAVYSDDRPIEFWRRLKGFKEGDQV